PSDLALERPIRRSDDEETAGRCAKECIRPARDDRPDARAIEVRPAPLGLDVHRADDAPRIDEPPLDLGCSRVQSYTRDEEQLAVRGEREVRLAEIGPMSSKFR